MQEVYIVSAVRTPIGSFGGRIKKKMTVNKKSVGKKWKYVIVR